MKKAIFLDRDGIVNELVFNTEHGIIDSPMIPSQVKLIHGIDKLLKRVKQLGFTTIICSNQPGIGLGKITQEKLKDITDEINTQLNLNGATIDRYYYCPHHPFAKLKEYKVVCQCRKPKIGLFLKAVKELDIDLDNSWFIGDGVDDIKAGKEAGCKTILVVNINSSENLRIIEEQLGSIKPNYLVKNLSEALEIIEKNFKKDN